MTTAAAPAATAPALPPPPATSFAEAGEQRQPERRVERLQLLGEAAQLALVGAAVRAG